MVNLWGKKTLDGARLNEKTPWYPISIKPVRIGVYEVENKFGGNKFSYWNGKYFECCTYFPKIPINRIESIDMKWPKAKWRGLTTENGK